MREACLSFPSGRSITSSGPTLLVQRNSPPAASAGVGAVDLLSPPWSLEHLSLLVLPLALGPFSTSSFSRPSPNALETFFFRVWSVTRFLLSLLAYCLLS